MKIKKKTKPLLSKREMRRRLKELGKTRFDCPRCQSAVPCDGCLRGSE